MSGIDLEFDGVNKLESPLKRTMYYVIETSYVGPNQKQDRYVDASHIDICTAPAVTNSSHEERIDGWCGTTNDWSVHAHGEYETIEAARSAIEEIFGDVRGCDIDGRDFEFDDETVVESYKIGNFIPLSSEASINWAYDWIENSIQADTTDVQVEELVAALEEEANENGFSLDGSLENYVLDHRQHLRDILEDEDEDEDKDEDEDEDEGED